MSKPLKKAAATGPYSLTAEDRKTIAEFHRIWHFFQDLYWQGIAMQKCPMDLMIYQEILYEDRPDLIIETGTWYGGSALYLAHLCDIQQHGMVVTIDTGRYIGFPQHPRIIYITGDSVSKEVTEKVGEIAGGFKKIMAILDSDHTRTHVLRELDAYAPLITKHQHLIVEDTDIHGHPVRPELPAGPWEALDQWLPKHPEFVRDPACERLLLTQNPGGYLRRID